MNVILNLTQHPATAEQIADGVVEPTNKAFVQQLITFDELPSAEKIHAVAESVAQIASQFGAEAAMIGGAPFFMAPLEKALRARGITPLYSFTRREAEEAIQQDGSIRKTQVFRHVGFIPA